MAALYVKLKSLNVKLGEKYERLGKLTYKQIKTEVSCAEEIAVLMDEIDALRVKVASVKKSIELEKEKRRAAAEEEADDKTEE